MVKKVLRIILLLPMLFLLSAKRNDESSYVLMEATSNRILESNLEDERLLIASTTKIMTAIVAIENYDIDEFITFTYTDVNQEGSKIYLEIGDSLTRRDLLYGLLLRSGNDAACALSNNDSFEFVYLMNEHAKKLGMTNSIFTNASGLDEKTYNLSTATDMAKLMIYAMKNNTFRTICSSKSHSTTSSNGKSYIFNNKHKLIKSGDVIAGKTGYTALSKRVLISYFENNNNEFVIVTINDNNDWNHHKELIKKTNEFRYKTICKAGIYETTFDVDYYLYVSKDIVLPLADNEKKVRLEFILNQFDAILYIYCENKLISKCKIETAPIG